MVYLLSVDQETNFAKKSQKMKQINQIQKKKNMVNFKNHLCEQYRTALIDIVILIVVIGACGVLLYPYVNLLVKKVIEFMNTIGYIVKDEILQAPMVYMCLGLSILFAGIALCAITICSTGKKCGKPGCRGLRKAAEFDIQLETEDCVKNSNAIAKDGVKKGLFELPRDHHRELEAELKKMAPPNGRAVLIFRGRCGCSVGTMEVPGPKKTRKNVMQAKLIIPNSFPQGHSRGFKPRSCTMLTLSGRRSLQMWRQGRARGELCS